MASQQEVIKAFMKALDNHTLKKGNNETDGAFTKRILDAAIKECSSFSSAQAVINQMLNDCKSYNEADSGSGWEDFLIEKCGINLDNLDTGAITGSDAGGSKIKTAESIVPENIALNTEFKSNSFKIDNKNLTVKLATGGGKNANPVEITFNDLSKQKQYLWQSLYSYWMQGGLDLISESYGSNFAFKSNSNLKTLYVIFDDEQSDYFKNRTSTRATTLSGPNTAEKCTIPLELHINMKFFSDISGENGGNSDGSAYYIDRTIAHELTHAVMMENVNYFFFLSQFIAEGMADLTNGIDDTRQSFITTLAKNPTKLEEWLDISDTTSNDNYVYAAGYMFLRYLAKQASTKGTSLSNSTKNKTMTGTANADTLKNYADNVTINALAGNDYIKNSGGNNVTISSGDGADQIYAHGNKISINTGKDDDFAYLYKNASNVTVVASEGNNEIHSAAQTALINAGNGNNYVELYKQATNTTVTTGTGKDKIYSAAQTALINAGAGNDYLCIYSSATKNTITAGTGNDTIENYGKNALFNYKAGDGNDKIIGFNDTSTLSISGSAYTTVKSGSDIIFTVGKEKVTLQGTAKLSKVNVKSGINKIDNRSSKVSVNGGEGIDSVYSSGSNVTIKVLGGNDTVSNFGSNVKIYGGAGDDSLYSHSNKSSVLIDTGAGNNYVRNFSSNVTIIGSDGKDTIYNDDDCNKVTIKSGAGNDSVRNIGTAVTIDLGAGNDSLSNENANVTITGGTDDDYIYNYSTGKNVLFKYASGDGNDKIVGFNATSTLSISSGYSSQKSGSNIIFTVGKGHITLQGAGNLSKVNVKSNVNSPTEGNDSISNTTSDTKILALGGNDTIRNYAKNVSIDAGKGNDNVYNYSVSSGSSIKGSENNDYVLNFADKVKIYGGDGDDTISNSNSGYLDGKSFSTGNVANFVTIDGGTGNDSIENTGSRISILGGAGNDYIYNWGASVTISGGTGNDSLQNYNGKNIVFNYASGDGNDKIIGFNATSTLSISSGTYTSQKSGSDIFVTVGNGKLILTGAANLSKVNIAGTKTSTLLTVTNSTKSPITVASSVKTIDASKRTTAVQITANDLANTIKGGKGNDTFYGGKGNDTILGSYGDDKLYGQAGNDTLTGGPGNDNLWGGDGNDVFIYGNGDGKDIINDYASGDKISVRGSISKAAASGSDVVFTIGKGSITVKNAKGKSLSMADNSGKNYSTIVGGSTTSTLLTVTNSTKSPITVASSVKTIDASKRTTAVQITANDLANTIKGGKGNDTFYGGKGNDTILGSYGDDKLYGQAGNDTLTGGKGNDSLWGDAGADKFVYGNGDGKDVIFGFENSDMLQIIGSFTTSRNAFKKEIYFNVGSTTNAITLKNYTATSFNVNGTKYKLGGKNLVK